MSNFFKLLIVLFLFSSCSSKPDEHAQQQKYFFDLAGYFKQQATALNGKQVFKTVGKNKSTETKTVQIKNWEQELQLFTECDINKPAWKDSYQKNSTANVLTYTSKEPDLRVSSIKITFVGQAPKKIEINTQSKNLLYHTTENLVFIPDSLYKITKHQKVILLGLNDYEITGLIKN